MRVDPPDLDGALTASKLGANSIMFLKKFVQAQRDGGAVRPCFFSFLTCFLSVLVPVYFCCWSIRTLLPPLPVNHIRFRPLHSFLSTLRRAWPCQHLSTEKPTSSSSEQQRASCLFYHFGVAAPIQSKLPERSRASRVQAVLGARASPSASLWGARTGPLRSVYGGLPWSSFQQETGAQEGAPVRMPLASGCLFLTFHLSSPSPLGSVQQCMAKPPGAWRRNEEIWRCARCLCR